MRHSFLKPLAVLLLATLVYAPATQALDPGDSLPALKVTTLTGEQLDFSMLRGKVVVLNLWATWCSPCRAEMPVLNTFYEKYRDRGVLVFGLSEDDHGDLDAVRKVMAEFSYPAGLAADAQENDLDAPRILPVTYIIDQQGKVRAKLWGGGTPVSAASLAATVDPLLTHASTK